jgi:hypothetical protein
MRDSELLSAYNVAFSRPAIKTPPSTFATVEAAEAAGWKFDAALGRWEAPPEVTKSIKKVEKLAKSFTSERVDAMTIHELREALPTLGHDITSLADLSEEALRQELKAVASEMQHKARSVRKNKLTEPLLSASAKNGGQPAFLCMQSCHSCGEPPTAGKKLMVCSQCRSVEYCCKECQRADWSNHKTFCKVTTARNKNTALMGNCNTDKFDDLMAWYQSVPNLVEGVICLAWLHRKESPYIRVKGGVNSRLATSEVVPRSRWGKLSDEEELLGMKGRFAQSDFRQEIHFFAVISAGHLGTSDWPVATPRMRFPVPSEHMDAWVAESMSRLPALKRMQMIGGK